MSAFNCILVANRGEIACRILRTLRSLGYRSVAVYSSADADNRHLQLADQSLCIGPASASQSYRQNAQAPMLFTRATASCRKIPPLPRPAHMPASPLSVRRSRRSG